MADEHEGTADPPEGGDAPGTDRVDALAAKVDKLTGLVEKVIDGAHGTSQDAVQARLSAPGDVAQIVREELARKDAQARDEDTRAKVESHAEILGKLAEAAPAAPVTRRHRFMGWGS